LIVSHVHLHPYPFLLIPGVPLLGFVSVLDSLSYPTQTQTQVREPLVLVRKDMDVNEHERLSNTDTNPSKGTTGISKKGY
jgi:hypothetical protein